MTTPTEQLQAVFDGARAGAHEIMENDDDPGMKKYAALAAIMIDITEHVVMDIKRIADAQTRLAHTAVYMANPANRS